jgi:nicotinamide-nucleotide amidase
MDCEIICVGTELLTGETLNTNAQYVSEQLSRIGVAVHYQTTIGDNPGRLRDCVDIAAHRSQIVVVTGGLGPTQDDLTKKTIADYFGMPLKRDEGQVEKMKAHFDRYNYKLTENNFRQCDIPVGAEAIDNTRGTAPGIHIEKNGVSVFLLPGPPEEMKAMLDLSVLPILKQRTHQLVLSRFFNICDMGESMVEEAILDLVKDQDNPTIATYAKPGEVLIRVTANGTDEAQVNALLDQYSKAIETRFGRHIFAHSSDPLSKAVADLLIKKGMTLAIADSGTGGMAGEILSGIDGMAKVFKLGLVVNDSQMKAKLLGVDSKAAGATAKQLFAISDCDINVAVSDLAKMPDDPLSAEVEIAICAGGKLQTETCRFKGSRRMIQTRAAIKVFGMIREVLL